MKTYYITFRTSTGERRAVPLVLNGEPQRGDVIELDNGAWEVALRIWARGQLSLVCVPYAP